MCMKNYQIKHLGAALLLAILLLTITGCSSVKEIESLKPVGEITIDGSDAEWSEGLLQQDNALLGFRSDEKYMYCIFITGDRAKARKLMMGGMTVYFENPESKAKIGIKYPEGFNPAELRDERPEGGVGEVSERKPGGDRLDRQMPKTISIVDKAGNQVAQILSDDDNGIVAGIKMDGPRFIYELKVPLTGNSSGYTIPAKAGEQILVTFQSGEIDRKKMRENMRGARGPEGEAGEGPEDGGSQRGGQGRPPGGGMRPGGGPGGERMRPEAADDKKIEMSFKVKLQK